MKYAWILDKKNKRTKILQKINSRSLRTGKVFSILASTEILAQTPLNCFNLFWCFNGLWFTRFLDIIGNLGNNHVWRYFWFLFWQNLHLQPLATLLDFFLLFCKLCKSGLKIIHYIFKVLRYISIVYIGRYLVLTYIEIFFQLFDAFLAIFIGQ